MSTRTAKKSTKPEPGPIFNPLPAAVTGLLSKRQVCQALGDISGRTLSEMISRGVFPGPDVKAFGVKLPRWSVDLVNRWVRDNIIPERP